MHRARVFVIVILMSDTSLRSWCLVNNIANNTRRCRLPEWLQVGWVYAPLSAGGARRAPFHAGNVGALANKRGKHVPGDADGQSRIRNRSRRGRGVVRGKSRRGQRATSASRGLLPIQRSYPVENSALREDVAEDSINIFFFFQLRSKIRMYAIANGRKCQLIFFMPFAHWTRQRNFNQRDDEWCQPVGFRFFETQIHTYMQIKV